MGDIVLNTEFWDLKLFKRGKVRDTYDLGDKLLMISTDRISAFDVVLPNGIPNKGKVLNGLSVYWFKQMKDIVESHLITADITEFPKEVKKYKNILTDRSMLVKKAKIIPIECVARGYLAGSAWKEYKKNNTVCGIELPKGLVESEKLPEPIFTPATKAITGHDINISEERASEVVGSDVIKKLEELTLKIYIKASIDAKEKGIIIADTKLEFGFYDNKIILVDEILTPDSSRFWSAYDYKPGKSQKSFDKQYVRDYLESLNWNKEPPAPKLPENVVNETSRKYLDAYERLTGKKLA